MPVRKFFRPVGWLKPVALSLAGGVWFFLAGNVTAQSLEEMQAKFRHGNYAEVIRAAQLQVHAFGPRNDWGMLLVQSLLTVGRYADASTNASAGLREYSGSIGMRLLARETALYQDDRRTANQRLTEIKTILEQRPPTAPDGAELVALGRALLLLDIEPRLVLENCYQRAEQMTPPPREAFLASGQLALDKHDFKLATDAFHAGLKIFPDDPDLLAGLARAFENGDRGEMLQSIEAALQINPRHIPTLLLLADYLIDAEQYDEAEKQLAIVLKVNPFQPEALAYRAVLAHLRNAPALEKQCRDDALKFYRTNPRVDHLIGWKLSQKYRFAEGAAAQRRALDFEPDFLPARRQLAEDLLRLGQGDEGWTLAEAVHQADAYDVTAYNLSMLHDRMEKFQTLTNAQFIVHLAPLEADLYGDRLLDLLGRARQTLCQKYGVQLTQPTVVEIFPEQKDFAVRTFGMPGNPGYLGVCFGSVITANSPASQMPNPANWEDVLWHEFCHVVTLTATKNRMPRWLSEGISVYEERQANPAWGERMNLAYREMILNGELTPISQLSSAFLSPTNSEHLQFAYYESSLAIEFVVQRFGFDALKKILGDLRDGVEINPSLAVNTRSLPELERDFTDFVQTQAEQLAPGVDLQTPPAKSSETDRTAWESQHPENYFVRLKNARDLMAAKHWTEARPMLESLAQAYHGENRAQNPLWLLAATQRSLGDTNAELATLKQFAEQEADFVDLFQRLIQLSEARQDWPATTNYVERLLAVNPLTSLPYRALATAAAALGDNPSAISAYRKLLRLDPPDPAEAHFQLARLLQARGGAEGEAKRQVLQALEDAPRFREAQRLLLEITGETSQPTAGARTSKQ